MSGIGDWERSFERRPWWTSLRGALAATIIVLAVAATIGVATTGSVFFGAFAAKHTIGARVTQRVYTPDNAIQNVAFFHDKCRAVVRDLATVKNNEARFNADRRAARFARDPIRQQQAADALTVDEQDVTGAKNALQADAQDYNSRSAQYTANPFKDAGLPYRIDPPTDDESLANFSVDCG